MSDPFKIGDSSSTGTWSAKSSPTNDPSSTNDYTQKEIGQNPEELNIPKDTYENAVNETPVKEIPVKDGKIQNNSKDKLEKARSKVNTFQQNVTQKPPKSLPVSPEKRYKLMSDEDKYTKSIMNAYKNPEDAKLLKHSLIRWMPSLKGEINEKDGTYDKKTQKVIEYLKRIYGTGKDGSSIDAKTAEILVVLRKKRLSQPITEKEAELLEKKQPGGANIYKLIEKHGVPPFTRTNSGFPITDKEYKELKKFNPFVENDYKKELTALKQNSSNNKTSVRLLQQSIIKWSRGLPNNKGKHWANKLAVELKEGRYGNATTEALSYMKTIYGTGTDGTSVDQNTSQMLIDLKDDNFAGNKKYAHKTAHGSVLYDLACRSGYPFCENKATVTGGAQKPSGTPAVSLTPEETKAVSKWQPNRIVTIAAPFGDDYYYMRADTASKFNDFRSAFRHEYPNYDIEITAGMDGRHSGNEHYTGEAVDIIVVDRRKPAPTINMKVSQINYQEKNKNNGKLETKTVFLYNYYNYQESKIPALLAKSGFKGVQNEYSTPSIMSSGSHIHMQTPAFK